MNNIQKTVLEKLKNLYIDNFPLGCIHDIFEELDEDDLKKVQKLNDKQELYILKMFIQWIEKQ